MPLSHRLKAMLNIAPSAATVADIGCDHGLLPIAFIRAGKAKRAIASDISAPSLQKGIRHAAEYDCREALEFRLGDGLSVLLPGEAELIIISGLGGEMIASILEAGKDIIGEYLLISANNADHLVRKFLHANGFAVTAEELVRENNRFYQLILAKRGTEAPYSETEYEFGRLLIQNRHPLLKPLTEKRIKDAEKMKKTAAKADNERANAAGETAEKRLAAYRRLIEWLSQ